MPKNGTIGQKEDVGIGPPILHRLLRKRGQFPDNSSVRSWALIITSPTDGIGSKLGGLTHTSPFRQEGPTEAARQPEPDFHEFSRTADL